MFKLFCCVYLRFIMVKCILFNHTYNLVIGRLDNTTYMKYWIT
jgi:hypothetical protein